MKKTLLIAVLLLTTLLAQAQKRKILDSFLGIKFRTSYAGVAEALKKQGGVVDSENEKHDFVSYTNVFFNKIKIDFTVVRFYEDQAYSAILMFKVPENTTLTDFSNTIANEIIKMRGEKGNTIKSFTEPFQEGDGKETEALNSGNAEFTTYWLDGLARVTETVHKGEVIVLYSEGVLEQLDRKPNN
jgi:hypothetical protein